MGIGKTMKNMLGSPSAEDTQLSPETRSDEGTASTIDNPDPDPNYKPAREPGRARSFSLGRMRSHTNSNPSARKSSTARKPPSLSSKYEELDRRTKRLVILADAVEGLAPSLQVVQALRDEPAMLPVKMMIKFLRAAVALSSLRLVPLSPTHSRALVCKEGAFIYIILLCSNYT
ncbi:hypothetical protein GALMADRAFT_1296403 [Galerina marginata CBS 339.88]|uniref:Uncharacterized protein n=1 Tax=Galerina marginata (strain CBS 339.88) TaxID=685588 RepID=A0A067TGB6_GALM3|nr:hypothetical protein GALMADRAFT_1296403 [Galerina marginata CBS 339.88]